MFSRQIVSNVRRVAGSFRAMSSGPLIDVAVDNDGIATVTMQRPPVNAMNLELVQGLSKAVDDITKNKSRALIITSSSPTVFSAGLDIMELFYQSDLKKVEEFWLVLQDLWIKLFETSLISAAAINGHAPAGGCILALMCEYRAMVCGKYTIGLNEAALGLVLSKWLMDVTRHTIGAKEAEIALTTAKMFSVEEALKVGLIDVVATDKADAVAKCKQFIKKFDRIPPLARALTKQRLREEPLKLMQRNLQADLQQFLGCFTDPKFQQSLEMYIHKIKAKKENT